MKRIFVLMAFVWLCMHTNAQFTLSGSVKTEDNQPLSGAYVQIDGTNLSTAVTPDGTFKLTNIQQGKHSVGISFLGYESHSEEITFNENVTKNFILKEGVTKFEEVVVSGLRAKSNTPTTYSMIKKKDIEKVSLGQDAPYILAMEPSVVVSSDAGAGIGYTSMHIRGSDNKKINVTINGVPLNDPESHGVYWVDVPDIASSAQSIQIQRGVGTSTNGSGAFGASINILTDNISSKPTFEYAGAVGSFNTFKNTIRASSGLIKNHWFIEAKAGQIKSDGYRDRARSDLKNYFTQMGYTSEKTVVKLLAFGGWEETYQAWYGVDKETLKNNRKYNPAGLIGTDANGKDTFYNDMVDHYQQDHLQLHFAHKFTSEISFNAAAHYTYGRGYYQDYVPSSWYMPLSGFNIPDIIRNNDTIQYSDLIHRLWLKNHFYGGVWGLTYAKNNYSVTWGGGINKYAPAKHFGEVIWTKEPEISLDGKHYYDNDAKKSDWNSYLKMNYTFIDKLNVFADLQLRGISYKAWGSNREYTDGLLQISENYLFFNPKIGAFYQIDNQSNIYASFAVANREPNRSDFLGAPAGEKPKTETLNDIELGFRHKSSTFSTELVLFNMNYSNQLVLTGQLDSEGTPLRKNVKQSYRRGVEFTFDTKPNEYVIFEQNIALSSNKINKYPIQDSVGASINKKTVDIAYSPSVIMGQKFTVIPVKALELSFLGKYVGKQYLDNSQSDERSLDSYYVFDFLSNYTLHIKSISTLNIYFKINNLLNEKYVSNGSISYGSSVYFPQAERNYMVGLTLKF